MKVPNIMFTKSTRFYNNINNFYVDFARGIWALMAIFCHFHFCVWNMTFISSVFLHSLMILQHVSLDVMKLLFQRQI